MLLATGALLLYGKRSPALASTARTEAPAAVDPPTSDVRVETTEVHIETSPIGALIEWGGRPLARTPAEIDLPTGTQTLKISHDGYEPEIVTLDVQAHVPIARAIALRPKVEAAPPLKPPSDLAHRAPAAPTPRPGSHTTTSTAAPAPSDSVSRKKFRVVGEDDTP